MPVLTLAFSSHWIETLPAAFELMRQHDAICLEEPPAPDFHSMLEGRISIEDYLLGMSPGFPMFSERQCVLLQRLFALGKVVLQVDPFLEILSGIHDFFGDGGRPDDIEPFSDRRAVYDAEKAWTAALLAYYRASMAEDFEQALKAVKAFARADAARGVLRDRLRAQKLLKVIQPFETVYVEAGYIHLALWIDLRRGLPADWKARRVHLMAPVTRPLGGSHTVLGPGDQLTLLYTFRPEFEGPRADLLAARSLLHLRLLDQEEEGAAGLPYPHTRNEIETALLVRSLSLEDCRRVYSRIRGKPKDEARLIIRAEAARLPPGGNPFP